jgi:hypothetical protein
MCFSPRCNRTLLLRRWRSWHFPKGELVRGWHSTLAGHLIPIRHDRALAAASKCTSITTVTKTQDVICDIFCPTPTKSTCKPGELTGPARFNTVTAGCTAWAFSHVCPSVTSDIYASVDSIMKILLDLFGADFSVPGFLGRQALPRLRELRDPYSHSNLMNWRRRQ